MNKVFIPILILMLCLVFCISCDSELPGTVHFVSVALSYDNLTRDTKFYYSNSSYTYWAYGLSVPGETDKRPVNPLEGTINDQKGLVDELKCLSDNKADFVLLNDQDGICPTEQNILDCISDLRVSPDDILIFHYSGHGFDDGSLVVNDTSSTNAKLMGVKTLTDALAAKDCNVVMLMDSCYSGNFVPQSGLSAVLGTVQETSDYGGTYLSMGSYPNSSFSEAVKNYVLKSDFRDRFWVLSASSDTQVAQEVTLINGNFGSLSMYVLDYLGYDVVDKTPSKIEDTTYTFNGMYRYFIYNLQREHSRISIVAQTPQTNFTPFDLVLFRT